MTQQMDMTPVAKDTISNYIMNFKKCYYHHLKIYKKYTFFQNFIGVVQKLWCHIHLLSHPWSDKQTSDPQLETPVRKGTSALISQ